ncbi:Putative membrane protein insertion efficiency factor (modular protein) [Methylocella tundrae]|uniref:Putative membrane protein insertion efficiency factor n=1 Tax=Methylocella tundrae TaxID=227605 RepID=A0A8B6M2X8_METTU|nr:Putative membrane protein insertion efficiency factor (modular protein) [Methylocella tundrae]VTZ49196.1 Putative membrane protein insertion efficiency factor (modular protein) [Methylocella tundrae]
MPETLLRHASTIGRSAARFSIRAYQLTFSSLVGSQCRHLPSCSAYVDEAIARHGLWAGGFMGFARLCRCQPFGTAGFDPVPQALPTNAHWLRPWSYGRWRGPLPDAQEPDANAVKLSGKAQLSDGKGDGAGVGDVEALDGAAHIEARDEVAVLAGEAAQPLAFAAKDERQRTR